jgi:hypothetical protein
MATEAIELGKDAFMRLVTQEHLQVEGPSAGYLYTGKRGAHGWELYKTADNPWYLYQARRVATNASANGNPIILDIAIPTGVVAKLQAGYVLQTTAGTHALSVTLLDEDNALMGNYGSAATAASLNLSLPVPFSTAAATGNGANSVGMMIGPGQKLTFATTGASANANDAMTVGLVLLLSQPIEPTWSYARSTDAANITLADSTISAENTLTLVPMP